MATAPTLKLFQNQTCEGGTVHARVSDVLTWSRNSDTITQVTLRGDPSAYYARVPLDELTALVSAGEASPVVAKGR